MGVYSHSRPPQVVRVCIKGVPKRRGRRLTLALQLHVSPFSDAVLSHSQFVRVCVKGVPTRRSRRLTLALQLHVSPFLDGG